MPPKIRPDEPVMSDVTILVSVEDLINLAMGPEDVNTVNYKMLHSVLHILARQLRLLETKVDIKISELPTKKKKKESSHSSESPPSSQATKTKEDVEKEKQEKIKRKKAEREEKEKATMDRMSPAEKEQYLKEKADEEKKLEAMSPKEKEKYLKQKYADEDQDVTDKKTPKEKKKTILNEDSLMESMSPQEKEMYLKQKEIDENIMKDMSPKEREKYLKQRERELKEIQGMSPKEKEKYFKEKQKEQEALLKMSPTDKEKHIKEKEAKIKEAKKGKESSDEEDRPSSKKTPKEKGKSSKERDEDEEEDKRSAKTSGKEKGKTIKEEDEDEDKPSGKRSGKEKSKVSKDQEEEEDKHSPKKGGKEKGKSIKDEDEDEEEDKRAAKKTGKEKGKASKDREEEEDKPSAKKAAKEKGKASKDEDEDEEEEDKPSGKKTGKEKGKALKDKEEDEETSAKKSAKEKGKSSKADAEEEDKSAAKKSAKEKDKVTKEPLERMSPVDREKEILGRLSPKEKEALQRMSPKEKEKYMKEREQDELAMERMSPKEREKYMEEKEALAKMKPKEREKYLKEKEKRAKTTSSGTSITVTEVERNKEKVLVVEKGPTTRAPSGTRTSIDVVTMSQFKLLQGEVEDLKKTAGPLPMPVMPDNKKLRSDIAKGSASLTDTMQAMQVSARVQAAEEGLARMAGLLTQLAASGALPEGFIEQIEQARADMEMLKSGKIPSPRPAKSEATSLLSKRKSVAIDASSAKTRTPDDSASVTTTGTGATTGTAGTGGTAAGKQAAGSARASVASRASQITAAGRRVAVTRMEMDDAIQALRDDLVKSVGNMTKGAAASADTAAGTAKGVAEKIGIAEKLNTRITDLFALTSDYAEQLSGFDAGLSTQMQSFQEQIGQMKAELKVGLATLETANNNAETAAVLELSERYTGLATELESSAADHQHLTNFQKQLADELRGLVGAVEMLREQKADRDEVWDGLRDKADMSKLEGLVSEQVFAETRHELDQRLEVCYDKFNRQEAAWMQALKDLNEIAETKAQIMQLLSIKSEAQDQLNAAHEKLKLLELQLGEPKAAILTRLLSKDGTCGPCRVPALMEGVDKTAGMPYPMPYFRTPPADELCVPAIPPTVIEDETVKWHACKRWVGGSHTLVSRSVPRELAAKPLEPGAPLKRYTGQGKDGRVYNLAEPMKPCTECNRYKTGAGDGEATCQCWPGVTDPALEVENMEAHFY